MPSSQNDRYLFEDLDVLHIHRGGYDVPAHVTENLSDHVQLRDYQKHALSNFFEYISNPKLSKNRQTHLLFHMATGSGKTVMMASLILHYYKQGYRNFLFFVNQTNIIEKTKANFLDPESSKYLFATPLQINGCPIELREVSNFSASDPDAINLCFTTTQKLHKDFFFPKENSLTIDDFEDHPVVMISDESHHVNTRTKRASKGEIEEDRSWEYTVSNLFVGNRENVLLEFTATADLRDPNIRSKYKDKIVFDYSLAKFRESGYTKDFQNLQSGLDAWGRTLQALVFSQYRRAMFSDGGISVKPVVLLKSQKIQDSKDFYDEFFARLGALNEAEIRSLDTGGLPSEVLSYFQKKDPTLRSLRVSIQQEFGREYSIIMNGSTDNSAEKQLAVNSLEDETNPYRIIFTVDMLNEGWDVLNLFDIVRLYETRQSGKAGKPSTYTIKEAQLIGRGARYYPFILEDERDDRDPYEAQARKYDSDVDNPRRFLETLLYHSKQDSKYITELRIALKATGLLPEEATELTYTLKPEFRRSTFFNSAVVFSNRREEVSRAEVSELDHRVRSAVYNVRILGNTSSLLDLFGTSDDAPQPQRSEPLKESHAIKDLPLNVVLGTMAKYEGLRFGSLKHYFPYLKSSREFVTSSQYLGATKIFFETDNVRLTAHHLEAGLHKVYMAVIDSLSKIETQYRGSKEFEAKPLNQILRDKRIQIANPVEGGIGTSQSEIHSSPNHVALSKQDWYVYNDNYGTSEEKAFVKYFSTVVGEFQKEFDDVYLVRNERIADLAIYSFDTGERFEPDFLLFLKRKGVSTYEQQQIYIEPKGDHLLETDKWKEEFLLSLEENAVPHTVFVDNTDYRIIGLPFFNSENKMTDFRPTLEAIPAG